MNNDDYLIQVLEKGSDKGNLLITSVKTNNKWIARHKKYKSETSTLIMQTTGLLVDVSKYNLYGKLGHTLYDFYYGTHYEFSGYKLYIEGAEGARKYFYHRDEIDLKTVILQVTIRMDTHI